MQRVQEMQEMQEMFFSPFYKLFFSSYTGPFF
jgi:hypothetical protein